MLVTNPHPGPLDIHRLTRDVLTAGSISQPMQRPHEKLNLANELTKVRHLKVISYERTKVWIYKQGIRNHK